ncbi:glycosyltransferase [Gramella sp. MT6]|uniref:glycosyltransferase n=1 Tax=Gramella sp. MT6 TaxID=2705471 RepID=UPI001C5F19F2|nr:glycosyltransferase [Gramella sp. MT6]QYA24430.1 glycosyltransferase [Gramella sp. MT6]
MGNKRILVAVLNWGLGHATRCIPIIQQLKEHNFEPIIASDGQALQLLKKEFPNEIFEDLPSYNIEYTKKGSNLKWKLLLDSRRIIKNIKAENELTKELVQKYNLKGIISDNRWGVRSDQLKTNVFITHQINVLSGNTTFLSSFIQQRYIKKFNECWIPDAKGNNNLSGILGHASSIPGNIKYIGPLSRFEKRKVPIIYDYLILLSGPEPQRGMLEEILLKEFRYSNSKVFFIHGVISEDHNQLPNSNIEISNYLFGKSLEEAINASKYIICRSGYTTLMDLAKLGKKAFFIPTPGQNEQEYLAQRMESLRLAPFCYQNKFSISKLKEIESYSGLSDLGEHSVFGDLFAFFEGE